METSEVLSTGRAAEAAGTTVDTVRYYDRCGLLDDLGRDAAGNRRFTADDVGWLRVLRCLRETGMSIDDLRRFVAVDPRGPGGAAARLQRLEEHREAVRDRIRRTEAELAVLETKIGAYRALAASDGAGAPAVQR